MNKVLIIDDDKELCALIKRSVLSENIEADFCNTGKEGLQKMNYPAASCGVSKVATSTNNPICYTALFSLRFYRLFYNFFPVPVLSHIYL